MPPINKKQLLIGIIALIIGLMVYFIDRPPESTYLVFKIRKGISLYNVFPCLFGQLGTILPAFIHIFSLSLITTGLLACGRKGCLTACMFWLVIDLTFEIGQKFHHLAIKLIPDFFSRIPVLEASKGYFILGTFDYYDLVAIFLGAIAACLIMFRTTEGVQNHETR